MEPRDISKQINDVAQGYQFAREPEFVHDLKEAIIKILRLLADRWRELFHHEHSAIDSHQVSTYLQVAIWAAAVAGIAVLLVALAQRAGKLQTAVSEKTRGAADIQEIWDSGGWRRQAEKLAAQNDYKNACRALYLSLLQGLHEHGIADFAPARTNYEYAYSLARFPQMQQTFKKLAERVENIWFGNREAVSDDYSLSLKEIDVMTGQMDSIQRERGQRIEEAIVK